MPNLHNSLIIERLSNTQVSRPWTVELVSHDFGTDPKTVYCIRVKEINQMQTYTDPCTYAMQSDMRQLKEMIASDLANYMLEMMPPLDMCVDWVCDRFALNATDELIDFVADCHDELFGN